MVNYLKTIEERDLRNRQAEVVVAIMGNVYPLGRDSEGFNHMLWDHLFVIADFDLDVDSPYERPTADMFAPVPERVPYTQSYVRQKQYGSNVRRMVTALCAEADTPQRTDHIANVAKFMKLKSFEYNREYPSNSAIIADITAMSEGQVTLDAATLDNTILPSVKAGPNNNQNGQGSGKKNKFPHKKYVKRK